MTAKSSTEVDALVESFGGIRKMARALGHKNPTTVQGWKNSGRIPPYRRLEIEAACKTKGVFLDSAVFGASEAA